MEQVIMEDEPFSFVECHYHRKHSKNTIEIGRKTLMEFIFATVEDVRSKLKDMLPDQFGLVFDGWTADGTSIHYVAVFATYVNKYGGVINDLLNCAPLLDETNYTAHSHYEYITECLDIYGKKWDNVQFICGDNCSTNKALADLAEKPLVGCASHRLNLAIQSIFADHSGLVDKVDFLMVELRKLKNAGKLRKLTDLCPERKNVTRWSSTYCMLVKYTKLREFLKHPHFPNTVLGLVPNQVEDGQIDVLIEHMEEFQSVTGMLQKGDCSMITLSVVRRAFDNLLSHYPDHLAHLRPNHTIVHNPHFENAVVKIQRFQESTLTLPEMAAVSCFRKQQDILMEEVPAQQPLIAKPPSAMEVALRDEERLIKEKEVEQLPSKYNSTKHVIPTSNVVERLFSRAKHINTDNRKSMDPKSLEAALLLRTHHTLWNSETIQRIINNNNTTSSSSSTLSSSTMALPSTPLSAPAPTPQAPILNQSLSSSSSSTNYEQQRFINYGGEEESVGDNDYQLHGTMPDYY
jgi:hypothetical protein